MTGSGDGDLVYPNPGSRSRWTDAGGRSWQRRGHTHSGMDEKRIRTLLRRPEVLLATWWAGQVEWADTLEAKVASAERLYGVAVQPEDVVASEWKADDGTVLLLLEHHC